MSTLDALSVSEQRFQPKVNQRARKVEAPAEGATVPIPTSSAPDIAPQTDERKKKRRVEEVEVDSSRKTLKQIIQITEANDRKRERELAKKRENPPPPPENAEQPEQTGFFAPQVEIVNGEIVIKEQSLEFTRTVDHSSYRRIEESFPKVNYHSYMKPVSRERWKTEETELFYKAIRQFGTDFALVQRLMPAKTREQVKAKFKKEERENPRHIAEVLLRQPTTDLEHYEDLIKRLSDSNKSEEWIELDEYGVWPQKVQDSPDV